MRSNLSYLCCAFLLISDFLYFYKCNFIQPEFSNGVIGCIFDDICLPSEQCYNDGLFGRCMDQSSVHISDPIELRLNKKQLKAFQRLLQQLIDLGFNWRAVFTQCVLRTYILGLKFRRPISLSWCETVDDGPASRLWHMKLVTHQQEHVNRLVDATRAERELSTGIEGRDYNPTARRGDNEIDDDEEEEDDDDNGSVNGADNAPDFVPRKIESPSSMPSSTSRDNKRVADRVSWQPVVDHKRHLRPAYGDFRIENRPPAVGAEWWTPHRSRLVAKRRTDTPQHSPADRVSRGPVLWLAGCVLLVAVASLVGLAVYLVHKRQAGNKCRRWEDEQSSRLAPLKSSKSDVCKLAKSRGNKWEELGSEEFRHSAMDISTAHAILCCMEDYLIHPEKLDTEWDHVADDEPDSVATCTVAQQSVNVAKNRSLAALPFDDNRVKLPGPADYINASYIYDVDPQRAEYVVAQSPLEGTVGHFWTMIWELRAAVLVDLTQRADQGDLDCAPYWPELGVQLFGELQFEVQLISSHACHEDYAVLNFGLKNLGTGESRTVTAFHYFGWPATGPLTVNKRSLLQFRRKVNRSFRRRDSPIVVHCSDGCSRSGAYVLLDMVLNRLHSGSAVKEVDLAASLEHLRDQRMFMVGSKANFRFVQECVVWEIDLLIRASQQSGQDASQSSDCGGDGGGV